MDLKDERKFTVVVPTMWRYAPFLQFLADLTKFELVDEIIIIDNDTDRTPDSFVLRHPKIRKVSFEENIFVNPAWNHGVEWASNDLVCIMNDDLIFDLRTFYRVRNLLSREFNLIGMISSDPLHNQPLLTDGSIVLRKWDNSFSTFGFGQLMFVHRKEWIPIPDSLKLYYGDDWIFAMNNIRQKPIYLITNMMFNTPCAVTSSEVKGTFLETESVLYYNEINRFVGTLLPEGNTMSFIESEYIKACKEPSDINEHLPTLKRLADECQTVMEFGVRTGVSTRAFLASKAALWSVDLKILPEAIRLIDSAVREGKRVACSEGNTRTLTIAPVDLLFIDTDHTYEQLSAELERHHRNVQKYIVLHDTTTYPCLMDAVGAFLFDHNNWSIVETYTNNNGLLVLQRD